MLGRTWTSAVRQGGLPRARAASTHSVAFASSAMPRARRTKIGAGGDGDGEHRVLQRRAEEGRQRDRQDQERHGQHRVRDAGDHRVRPAAGQPGQQPDGHADQQRGRAPTTTPATRDARAPQSTRDSTSRPFSSVPNQCSGGRRLADAGPGGRDRIVGREDRGEQRRQRRRATTTTSPNTASRCRRKRRSARRPGLSRRARAGGRRQAAGRVLPAHAARSRGLMAM